MDHVAIMKKSWGLVPKILSGEKKIESRWYKIRCVPWDKINAGDTVYFKNTGESVTVKAKVAQVKQYSDLTPGKVKKLLNKYGKPDGLGIKNLPRFFKMFKDKNYCILAFLENPQKVTPFNIDKSGFGMMAAWLTTDNVERTPKEKFAEKYQEYKENWRQQLHLNN